MTNGLLEKVSLSIHNDISKYLEWDDSPNNTIEPVLNLPRKSRHLELTETPGGDSALRR